MKGFGYIYNLWADMFFGSPQGTKYNKDFQLLQDFCALEKYGELSKLVAFAQNWGFLQTIMDQSWGHMKINFDYFQIQK